MSLRTLLILSYVFMALLAALVGFVGLQVTQTIHSEFEFVRNDLLPVSDALDDLRQAGLTIASSAAEYGLVVSARLPSDAGVTVPQKKLTEATADFIETLIRYEKMVKTLFPEEEVFLAEVRLHGGMLQAVSLNLMDVIRTGQDGKTLLQAYHDLQVRQDYFQASIEKAIEHEKGELLETKDRIDDVIHDGRNVGAGFAVLAFFLALSAGVALAGRLAKPLSEVRKVAERLGQGQLDARLDVNRGGEVGALMKAINLMADDLENNRNAIYSAKLRWKNIFHSIPDGLVVTDSQHRIVMMNHAGEQLLNISFEEVEGQFLSSVLKSICQTGQAPGTADDGTQVEVTCLNPGTGLWRRVGLTSSVLEGEPAERAGTVIVLRELPGESPQ